MFGAGALGLDAGLGLHLVERGHGAGLLVGGPVQSLGQLLGGARGGRGAIVAGVGLAQVTLDLARHLVRDPPRLVELVPGRLLAAPGIGQVVGQALEPVPRLVLAAFDLAAPERAQGLGGAVELLARLARGVAREPVPRLFPRGRLDRLREPADGLLAGDERLDPGVERGLFLGVQVVLRVDLAERLGDVVVQDVLAAFQAPGEGLGIVRDVLQVARQPAQLGFGPFEPLAGLVEVAALDRLGGLADLLGVEPAPAVLGEWLIDLQREPPGLVFEGALEVGDRLELRGVPGQVGRLLRLLALAPGQLVGLPGQGFGLPGQGVEDLVAELGRRLEQGVQVVLDGVLLGLEPVEQGAVAGPFGVGGDRLLTFGQGAEPLAVGLALVESVELALKLFQPLVDGGEPGVGLAEVGEALGGVVVVAGLVEHGAAGLGLDLGNLPGGSGERAELGIVGEVARQELEPIGHGAGLGLAVVEGLLASLVPGAVAALGGVGGVAELLGLLPVRGRRLLHGVELRLQRLAAGLAPPRLERRRAGDDRQVVARRPDDVRPARLGPVVGHAHAIRERIARLEPERPERERGFSPRRARPQPRQVDRDLPVLGLTRPPARRIS